MQLSLGRTEEIGSGSRHDVSRMRSDRRPLKAKPRCMLEGGPSRLEAPRALWSAVAPFFIDWSFICHHGSPHATRQSLTLQGRYVLSTDQCTSNIY